MADELAIARVSAPQSIVNAGIMHNAAIVVPLLASMLAWLWLMIAARQTGGLALCFGPGQLATDRLLSALKAELYMVGLGRLASEWVLMVCAMMLPIIVPHLVMFRARLFRAQQSRAVTAVVAGYLLVWFLIGIPLCAALLAFRASITVFEVQHFASIGVYLIVLGWVWMPQRQSAFIRCHRSPLLIGSGLQILGGSFQYGARLGRDCAVVCLPVMAAPMFASQSLFVMFVMTHALLAERLTPEPNIGRVSVPLSFVCAMVLGTLFI